MTSQAFLDLSTKLCQDMKNWVAEAHHREGGMTESDLAMLNASMKIVERVTLKEVEHNPEQQ